MTSEKKVIELTEAAAFRVKEMQQHNEEDGAFYVLQCMVVDVVGFLMV